MPSEPIAIDAVPGLVVHPDFFSHNVEYSLYHNPHLFEYSPEQVSAMALRYKSNNKGKNLTRHGTPRPGFQQLSTMPQMLTKVCNGIVESGLYEDFIACDYCLPWSYPDKGQVCVCVVAHCM